MHVDSNRKADEAAAPHRVRSSRRFTEPVVAKQGNLFLLSTDTGDVQADSDQGLYFHDMRYVSAETLRLGGATLVSLLANASDGDRALFELTNPDLDDDAGQVGVRKEALGIRREKYLGDDYAEVITVQNYASDPAQFTVQLHYEADFADMFVVRGVHPGKRGRLHQPRWRGSTLTFRYDGADKHERITRLHFSRAPDEHHAGDLVYRLTLKAQQQWQLKVTCELSENQGGQLESRRIQPKVLAPEISSGLR